MNNIPYKWAKLTVTRSKWWQRRTHEKKDASQKKTRHIYNVSIHPSVFYFCYLLFYNFWTGDKVLISKFKRVFRQNVQMYLVKTTRKNNTAIIIYHIVNLPEIRVFYICFSFYPLVIGFKSHILTNQFIFQKKNFIEKKT